MTERRTTMGQDAIIGVAEGCTVKEGQILRPAVVRVEGAEGLQTMLDVLFSVWHHGQTFVIEPSPGNRVEFPPPEYREWAAKVERVVMR